jgi:hypothetical protein
MDYVKMLVWLAVIGAIVLYGSRLVGRAAAKTGV